MLKDTKSVVATLTLNSRPRQGLAKVWAKRKSLGITFRVPESARKCERMNPTHAPK